MSAAITLGRQAQHAAVARLAALGELRGVPVLERLRADVASDVDAALASVGAAIFVFPGLPTRINQELPGPYVEELEIRVRVFEVPEVNLGNLPDAYQLAEYVLAGLHHHCPRLDGQAENPFVARAAPISDQSDDATVIFDITFTLSAGIQLRAGEAATPIV